MLWKVNAEKRWNMVAGEMGYNPTNCVKIGALLKEHKAECTNGLSSDSLSKIMERVIGKFGWPSKESKAGRKLPALQRQTALLATVSPSECCGHIFSNWRFGNCYKFFFSDQSVRAPLLSDLVDWRGPSRVKVAESGPFMGLWYRLSVIAICHASSIHS